MRMLCSSVKGASNVIRAQTKKKLLLRVVSRPAELRCRFISHRIAYNAASEFRGLS